MSLKATYHDAFNLLCGSLIGRGQHRYVYACKLRPDLVVKVESDDSRFFANVREELFWSDHRDHAPSAKWLAPVEFLSPDGRLLLMKRCDPLPLDYRLPQQLPSFLDDHKRDNFGLLDGRLVCVDYGITRPNLDNRLVKAHW